MSVVFVCFVWTVPSTGFFSVEVVVLVSPANAEREARVMIAINSFIKLLFHETRIVPKEMVALEIALRKMAYSQLWPKEQGASTQSQI
jgi:hypothetical protein